MGSWPEGIYPGLDCDAAIPTHEGLFGPAPQGYEYRCYFKPGRPELGIPDGSLVYAWLMGTLYRMVVEYEMIGPDPNVMITTHDWQSTSDVPLIAGFEAVETLMDGFQNGVSSLRSTVSKVVRYRWYGLKDDGSGTSGPSFRAVERNIIGGGAKGCPTQVACSVTEMTAERKRWGRFYIPIIRTDNLTAEGRLTSSACGVVASEAATMLAGNTEWTAVVYGSKSPQALPILNVRVDDTLDIIRSRRWKQPTHRSTVAVP